MASNVYTKNEILQNLASRGYFVDIYTLETFFQKWKIEAIFEDEQGSEFFDKNALDIVLSNLFNAKAEDETLQDESKAESQVAQPIEQTIQPSFQASAPEPVLTDIPAFVPSEQAQKTDDFSLNISNPPEFDLKIDDSETLNVLNNISLSDGASLLDKIQQDVPSNFASSEIKFESAGDEIPPPPVVQEVQNEKKPGLLEGALGGFPQEEEQTNITPADVVSQEESPDFDDISLISESFEAQEKFKDYLVSELSKKNVDLSPKSNEFKLDISERTLSMIARSMAKKIAKHVSSICSADAKNAAKLADIQEINKKLEQRTRELEDQNKKLRLLLAESNKNLNSYKPSLFGLYKKVTPRK